MSEPPDPDKTGLGPPPEPIIPPTIDLVPDMPREPEPEPDLGPTPAQIAADAEELAAARAQDEAEEKRRREDPNWDPTIGYITEEMLIPDWMPTPPAGAATAPAGDDSDASETDIRDLADETDETTGDETTDAANGAASDAAAGETAPSPVQSALSAAAFAAALSAGRKNRDDDFDEDDDGEPDGSSVGRRFSRGMWIVFLVTFIVVATVIGLTYSGFFSGPGAAATPSGSVGGTPGAAPTETLAAIGPAPCEVAAAVRTLPALTVKDEAALCSILSSDSPGDWVEYNGSKATVKPTAGDIVSAGLAQTTLSAEQAAALAAMCDAGTGLHCHGSKPAAGSYLTYTVDMAEPVAEVAGAFFETGIGFLDSTPPGGGAANAWNGPPADVLTGHNTVYTLRFASGQGVFGPFRLFYSGPPTSFMEQPSGAFDFVSGNVVIGFIPSAEWDGAKSYRFFSYFSLNDNSGSAADEAPDYNQPAIPAPPALPVM